ncbi:MAG: sulfatase [Myxococcota bacterium]
MRFLTVLIVSGACEAKGSDSVQAVPAAPGAPAALPSPPPPPPELAGPQRTVYDFDANRPASIAYASGSLTIDCGGIDFLKFVHGGFHANWYVRRVDGDKRVAYVAGVGASIRFPLDADEGGPGVEGAVLRATLRPLAPKQRVSVFLNEKPVDTLDLADGWQTIGMPLAPAAPRAGENKLRFQFRAAGAAPAGRSAAAFERIEILPSAPSAGDRRSYFLWIPPSTKLAVGGAVRVRAALDGAPSADLVAAGGRVADLAPLAGQFARLDFLGDAAGARIVAPEPAATPASAKPKVARHVFIWLIDTLRPDHVASYNPATTVKTPNLDAFAARGTRFHSATVQGNWSMPSHASILTGTYPSVHRGYDEKSRVSREMDFVGEVFQRHGFTTATFLSNGYVSDKWGFGQGWDHYKNFVRDAEPSDAKWLWTHAMKWLSSRKPAEERLFVYLGTIDPHVIYNPPKEYLAMYHPEPYGGSIRPNMTGILLGKIKAGAVTLGEADKRYLHALYQGEITYNDFWFGKMQEDLQSIGALDDSVIVVVSDHGDEFYEHGSVGHGHSVYQELVATPLIMAGAGVPAGRVVYADVETLDILPSLLDATGLPSDAAPAAQGDSLLALARDDGPHAARPAFSTHGGTLFGMKLAHLKLVTSGPERAQLFDLTSDPTEQKDVLAARPIAARAAIHAFALHYPFEEKWKKRAWGVSSNLTAAFGKDNLP